MKVATPSDSVKIESVIKLQALVRGYYARMLTRVLKKSIKKKKKYFLEEEFWETISKSKVFNMN